MTALGYILQLWPTEELTLETYSKVAREKKHQREVARSLEITAAPAAPEGHRELVDNCAPESESRGDPLHYELPFADGFSHDPTHSVLSRNPKPQFLRLLTCAPIVDEIVSNCSASSLANFFCALGMEPPTSLWRHITPLRDIFTASEMKRVHELGRQNHTVIAVGKDLYNIWKKLRDPKKHYADPNRQTKFHVWVVIVQGSYNPSYLGGVLSGPMSRSRVPGEWMPGPSSRMCLPERALKWNTDPAIHVEWYYNKFHRTLPLVHSFALPTELTTTGFMWNWDRKTENPVLEYINARRDPYAIRIEAFKNLGLFPESNGRFGMCRHWLVIRLGESCNPLGDWNVRIRLSSCCKRPECAKPPRAQAGLMWECCSCNGSH